MKKYQNSNNNDKSKLSSARSESSFYFSSPNSARSELSKKISISDDQFDKNVYSSDVAYILESKNETQNSFEYLKNNTEEIFLVIQIFLIQV